MAKALTVVPSTNDVTPVAVLVVRTLDAPGAEAARRFRVTWTSDVEHIERESEVIETPRALRDRVEHWLGQILG